MGDHTLDRHLLHRRVSGKWLIASGSYKQSTISAFFLMLELDCCLNNAVRYFSVPFASLKTFATHRILSTPWNVSFIIELRSYLNLTSSSLFRLNSAIYSVGSKHLPLNTKILHDEIIFCMGDDKNCTWVASCKSLWTLLLHGHVGGVDSVLLPVGVILAMET